MAAVFPDFQSLGNPLASEEEPDLEVLQAALKSEELEVIALRVQHEEHLQDQVRVPFAFQKAYWDVSLTTQRLSRHARSSKRELPVKPNEGKTKPAPLKRVNAGVIAIKPKK